MEKVQIQEKHYIRHRERLRERFMKSSLEAFQDYEAVELLLTLAIPRKDVKEAAKETIEKFGSFQDVLDAPVEELMKIKGIGEVAPIAIRFIREAANRYLQQKSRLSLALDQPQLLLDYCRAAVGARSNEVFKVIYLDGKFRLKGDPGVLAEGTVDRAAIYPRKVMESALTRKATALVFVHNHTNGDVTPSEQDKVTTQALLLAAKTLQINVYDHLIVSKDDVFSFREKGLL